MTSRPRAVAEVIEPLTVMEGAGVRLKRSIATARLDYLDPFLLFDHFGSDDPADYLPGFPMHPHRGIETVTYMLAGRSTIATPRQRRRHRARRRAVDDRRGSGILHEEMPRPRDGMMGGFQLWVNLPAQLKMTAPRYQDVPSATIPEVVRDGGERLRVVAGEVDGVRGPVKEIYADPSYFDVNVPAGGCLRQPISRGHAAFAYVFEGEGLFGADDGDAGRAVGSPRLAVLSDGDELVVRAGEEPVRFLLVSGKPLGEPIARYGPFVMNTRQEIEQALRELRDGTFVY